MGRKVSKKSAINYYKNSSAYRKMCKDLMMKYKRYGRLTGRISKIWPPSKSVKFTLIDASTVFTDLNSSIDRILGR